MAMMEVIMNLNSETRMKDIALSNSAARQVLQDAGLDYCCGGGKSLHEACLHADASAEEILNRLRENAKDTGPEDVNWMAAPVCELTRRIREKHHRYVREARARTDQKASPMDARILTRYHEDQIGIRIGNDPPGMRHGA